MFVIYVGDAKDVVKRICSNHYNGNVEASALRKSVAIAKGYPLKKTKRPKGSTRIRIDLPDPNKGEKAVSDYLQTGVWRFVLCASSVAAKDFQWYAIDQLKPLLNKTCKPWDPKNLPQYQELLLQLNRSPALVYGQLRDTPSGPGVYVFYHQQKPGG